MKANLIFTLIALAALCSCKKNKENPSPDPVPEIFKYSKIQSFYTPYADNKPSTDKSYQYSLKEYDSHGNITLSMRRLWVEHPDSTKNPKQISTFKYENNRPVEETTASYRYTCKYNKEGDTLELQVLLITGQQMERYVYSYGSNGKKSQVVLHNPNTGKDYYKYVYKYDDRKNIIEMQALQTGPPETLVSSISMSYDDHNNILKRWSNTVNVFTSLNCQYVYNSRGWILELFKEEHGFYYTKHVNTYHEDGRLDKQDVFVKEGIGGPHVLKGTITYVYTERK